MNGKELDLSKIADMIAKTAENARDKLENQSDKMYSIGEDMMSSVGDGALAGAKNAATSIEAAGDIITQKYQKVLDEIKRSGKKKGDIASLFATITQIKRSDLNSFNALKDELKDIKATFTDIGEVKGLDAVLKQFGKTADKLRSIDFGFGSAFVARGRATGTKNIPHVDEVEKVETSLADAAQQSRKTAEIIQSNNIKQIQSFQDLVNLLTEYKRLIGSIKDPKLPQLYEDIETVKANLEIEGSRIQQRDMAKREIQARYKRYQNERKAYDNGGSYVNNGQIYDVSSYTDLARSEEYLKVLIALYIRCGGAVDKLSKKVKQFAEDNDIVGVLRETEEEYRNIINETHKQNVQTVDNIRKIRESVGYKEDGSNTSLAIGSVLDSIQHGGNIEEAADVLFQILSTKKDIISTNQELATSEERVAESVDEASSNSEQRLKQLIQNQKEWLEYLDSVLNDENFKSSGKRDATQKLKARTQSLIQQRANPDQSKQYGIEMAEVAWKKAYDEAKRQGVADSTLTRYSTDAGINYERNLSALQKERELRADTLAKAEEELATVQRTTEAINAENAELSKQQKIVNSSDDIKRFQDEYAKAAKNHSPEDMGQRYGYLMEAISGDSPTMSAVDALNELIAKEQEWKAEQEAALEASRKRGEEVKAFCAAATEYQETIFSSESVKGEYAKALESISSGAMSATEGMETLKAAIEKYNTEIVEAVPSTQQQSEAEQGGVKAATEAAEAHREAASAASQEAEALDDLQNKQQEYSLTNKDLSYLFDKSRANMIFGDASDARGKKIKKYFTELANAGFNLNDQKEVEAAEKLYDYLEKQGRGKQANDKPYAMVYDFLKNLTVRIPENMEQTYEAEFPDQWKQIKKRFGGSSKFKIRVGGNGLGVDQLYSELQTVFPYIFRDGMRAEPDLLREILDAAEKGRMEAKLPKNSVIPLQQEDWFAINSIMTSLVSEAQLLRREYDYIGSSADELSIASERTADSMEMQSHASKSVAGNLMDAMSEEDSISPIGLGLSEEKARDTISGSKKPTARANVFNNITNNSELQTAFQSIIEDIEQQSMTLVRSDIMDSIDKNGTGTLKFVSDDMNSILVQTWKMIDGQLKLASEKYTSTFKVDKTEGSSFDAEGYKKVALAKVQTLKAQFKGFANDENYAGILSGVENAANSIVDADSLKAFTMELNAAKESLKQLKAEMSSSKSLDPLAAAEKTLNKFPIVLDKIETEYQSLKEFDTGDILGAEGTKVEGLMQSVRAGMDGFNDTSRSMSDRLSSFKDALKSFDQLGALMSNLRAKAKESNDVFIQILNTYKELTKLQEEQKKAEVSGATDEKKQLIADSIVQKTEKLKQLGIDINKINENTNLTTKQRNRLLKEQEEASARIKKIEVDAANSQAQKEKRQSLNYGKGAFNSETRKKDNLSAIYSSIEDNYGASAGLTDAMNAYLEKYKQFETARQKIADPTTDVTKADRDAFNKAKIEVESARKALEIYTTSYSKLEKAQNDGTLLGMDDTVDPSKLQNSTAALKAYGAEISNGKLNVIGFNSTATEMYGTIDRGKGIIDQVTVALESSTGTLYAYKTATKEVGTAWEKFKGIASRKAKEIAGFLVGGSSIYAAINQIQKGITYVKEIDAALTELKKVTDETDATYKKFLTTASQTAGQIGSTVKDFTNATADFARLGYNIEQASDLAKAASVYANVGDEISDISEASDSIISTMHGFGIEAGNAMTIVDKFNEVGNNFAISSSGIGQALLRSASAMAEAGNTIDESIGLITAANSVVQNPETVGTAMKTLSLRIRGAKVELEDAGEDVDGMVSSVSELQKKLLALTGGKVNIMLDENTFKNTTEILREMSTVWDDMTDVNRAAALELLGGKRQANVLAAVIKNFDMVEDAIKTSADSAGSAMSENEKYMDSIQGHVDRFNNSIQTMWNNIIKSDYVKAFVDIGTSITTVIDKLGLLGTTITVILGKHVVKAMYSAWKAAKTATEAEYAQTEASAKAAAAKTAEAAANAAETATEKVDTYSTQENAEATAEKAAESDAAKKAKAAEAAANAADAATEEANSAEKEAGKYTWGGIKKRAGKLKSTITKFLGTTIGKIAAGAGIALLAVGIAKGIDSYYKKRQEELIQEAKDLSDNYKNAKTQADNNIKALSESGDKNTYKTLSDEFSVLAKGVDKYGNNISLTSDQYERYKSICEQIVSIQPSIADGYDSATKAIGNNASAIEELVKAQQDAAKTAALKYTSDENLNKIRKGVVASYNKANSSLVESGQAVMSSLTGGFKEKYGMAQYNGSTQLSADAAKKIMIDAFGYDPEEVNKIILQEYFDKGGNFSWTKWIKDYSNELKENQNKISDLIDDSEKSLDFKNAIKGYEAATNEVKQAQNDFINTLLQVPVSQDDYAKLGDSGKSFITEWIKNSDAFKIDSTTSKKQVLAMRKQIREMVAKLAGNQDAQDILDSIFSIDTSNTNFDQYKKDIDEWFDMLFGSLGITDQNEQKNIKIALGFDFDVADKDGNTKQGQLVKDIARVTNDSEENVQKWLDSQPAAKVQAMMQVDWSAKSNMTKEQVADEVEATIPTATVSLYSDVEDSISKFHDVLSQTEDIMLDNTEVTQEYKDSLVALGISEDDLASCFDQNNGLVVKNVSRLKQLVNASKANISTQTILARAQARLKYKELYKQLATLTNGQLDSAQANREKINTLYQEMSAIQKVISRYSLLEQQLSEVIKIYSEFEEAQSFDSANDYMSKTEDMLTAAIKAYETGDLGTETAQVAIKALTPDVEFEGLDTVDEKAEKAHEYLTETLNKYFTIELDDNGAIQSAEMKLGNLRKFIEDAFSNNVFSGEDWQHFEWSDEFLSGLEDAPDKLQYFADKMNVTKEVALSAIQEIKNKDAEWLNGDYGSLFDQIVPETLDAKLQDTTAKLAELNVQLANGKVSQEEYETAIKQLNTQLVEQQKAASDACQSFIDVNGKIDESQQKLEAYQKQLSTGTDTKGNQLTSEQIEEINGRYNKELQNYEGYLQQKQELENKYGPMTEYTVSVALEQNGINVDEINTELTNVKQNIQEAFNSDNFTGANKALEDTYGVIAKINENGDIEYSVTDNTSDDQKKTLEELGALNADGTVDIDCLYSGLTDEQKAEVDKLETLQEKKNLIDYYLSMDGVDTAQSAIDELATTLTNIYELLQTSPMFKASVDEDTKTTLDGLLDKVNSWVGPHWATFKAKVSSIFSGNSGDQESNGTANVSGTAHATGSWGLEQSEHNALVGELGMETVVDPNTGRYYTVGDHGAELVDLPKNAIIFNHKQTDALFRNGYINSRGKAFANGNAHIDGNAHVTIYPNYTLHSQWEGTGYKSYDDGMYSASNALQDAAGDISSASDSVEDAADDAKQTIDFIEYRLDEIENIITNTTNRLENFLDDTSQTEDKNSLYEDLVSAEKQKASTYFSAAATYNKKAAQLLSEVPAEYQEMAKNGAIAIKDFIGENEGEIADAIEEYRTWSSKAEDAENNYLASIAEISAKRLEQLQDIADDFENIVGLTEQHANLIQAEMDLLDEAGERLSENFYNELMKDSKKQIEDLNNKRASLQDILDNSVKSGDVQVGSDDWYEMVNSIYDVDDAILECKKDIEGFQNSINDLYWDNLDKLIDKIDNVDSELSHLYNLVSDEEKVVDDAGNWTKDGVTALGLLAQQLEVANFKVEQYGEAIARLEKDYAAGLYSTDEYNEKLAELKENQWDAIEAQESAKKSIIDLNKTRIQAVKDGMQKEIDAYSELIDKKKEELNLQKESHDFSKQVAEQQKNIADIEKRIAVISGDNSASAIAQKKKLQAELAQAKEELEELYYDHSVEKQQDALDKQLEDYQNNKQDEMDALDESLKNEDQIIQDSYATIAANTESLAQNLSDIADKYGITLSDSVTKPWIEGVDAIGIYQEKLDTSASAFTEQLRALKQELVDLQVEADKTADSIIKATNSKKNSTESAKYTPPTPSTPQQSPATEPSTPAAPTKGSSVTVKSSATHFSRDGGSGTRMQSWVPGSTFTVYQATDSEVLIGRNGGYTGWVRLSDIEGYSSGAKSIDKDQFAFLDELGEELQLVPDGAGRLSYIKKGTGIIPADLTERLMEWGKLDPSSVLEQSRPVVSAPHVINNNLELNLQVGEVVHIDRADNSSIPNITKAVQDQMDNYMKNINKKLYNRVR